MKEFILGEKLKEEIGGQKVIAAFFTSFNFDPDFFENYLLPLFLPDVPFGDNKIQNTILWKKFQSELPPITVYCDFHAKSQKGIHLNYTIRTIDVPKQNGIKGCFHPKHSYILLEDESLIVFVGSNNLTESGWCSNLEGVNFFRLKPKVQLPSILKKQLWFFIENLEKPVGFSDSGNILWEHFFKRQTYTDEVNGRLLNSIQFRPAKDKTYLRTLINDLIRDKNNHIPFKKIEIISPYYPGGIKLFNELKEASGCEDISLSIPFENTDFVSMDEVLFNDITEVGYTWKGIKVMNEVKGYRFNHSKIYQFVGEEKVFIVVGSLNFTNMAWKGTVHGGNYETGVIYELPIEKFESLLVEYPMDKLSFSGHKAEENHIENRPDAFDLTFIIDWISKELEIVNPHPETQKGYIILDEGKIQLQESQTRKLKDGQLQYFSNTPLIKVRPKGSKEFLYYYPIHKNISSKPLPDNIRLNDTELLQLWLDLKDAKDKDSSLRIIDRFIDRITDESGELKQDEIERSSSTLNLMATHLSGLIQLNKKVFTVGGLARDIPAEKNMLDYYLFGDNVDTLLGYRRLLNKMAEEGRLNNGFHWILLNILEKTFYQRYPKFELFDKNHQSGLDTILHELKSEIRKLSKLIESDRVTAKHLKWAEKMILEDAE